MIYKFFKLIRPFFLIILLNPFPGNAYAAPNFQEVNTAKGKVIVGLTKDEALTKYGYPNSINRDIWHYSGAEDFFVCLSSIPALYLYPLSRNVPVGMPLELKVLSSSPESQIIDVTSDAEFVADGPHQIIQKGQGVIILTAAGEYQVLAKYNGNYSNPCYLTALEQRETGDKKNLVSNLVSIEVLPYKPVVSPYISLDFFAFGVFHDHSSEYSIKDLSNDVLWFVQKEGVVSSSSGRSIQFSEEGRFKVFCQYSEFKSQLQEVEVVKGFSAPPNSTLKNITILPEFALVNLGQGVSFKPLGTYEDNSVVDLSGRVSWNIENRAIISLQNDGTFLANSEGITGITAVLDNIGSLSARVSVVRNIPIAANKMPEEPKRKEQDNRMNKVQDEIQDKVVSVSGTEVASVSQTETVKESLFNKDQDVKKETDVEPIAVNKMPEEPKSKGQDNRVNKIQDKVVSVSGIKVASVSQTETVKKSVFNKDQDVKKDTAVEPRLLSIILSPTEIRLSMFAKAPIKAEGYFTDNSRKDITSLVEWKVANPGVARIKANYVIPRFFGKTQVHAEDLTIKSLPANISIFVTLNWIIWMMLWIGVFIILIITVIFLILYMITLDKKRQLMLFLKREDKRDFIINIYQNSRDIIRLFGINCSKFISPRSYASIVEQRYAIRDKLFSDFTLQFEEAQYSNHTLRQEDALLAIDRYSNLVNVLINSRSKPGTIFVYLHALVRRQPINIGKIM